LSWHMPISRSSEGEEDLMAFFRRFLNTPEEMDAHLGLKSSH
jgi:hypothetical protein